MNEPFNLRFIRRFSLRFKQTIELHPDMNISSYSSAGSSSLNNFQYKNASSREQWRTRNQSFPANFRCLRLKFGIYLKARKIELHNDSSPRTYLSRWKCFKKFNTIEQRPRRFNSDVHILTSTTNHPQQAEIA